MNTKMAMAMCMAAGMACGAANGQINVISTSGLARATAGDGSGSNQQTSANLSSFNLGASKSFQNGGNVQANNNWSLTGNVMQGAFSSTSFAASQFEAGWAETDTVVNFDLPEDMDIEYQGGGLVDSPSGFLDIAMRHRTTNQYVVGGNLVNLVHVAAGPYKMIANSYNPYGSVSGSYELLFRPGNDRCQFARVVTSGIYDGSTANATIDGQATCGSNSSRSVWYKWTAPRSGDMVITTCGSAFDTVLSIYDTNSCPSGTGSQVICNDDAPSGLGCNLSLQSAVTFAAAANETYYIRIAGFNPNNFGNYQLNVGPINNDCDHAQIISSGVFAFSNLFATTDGPVLSSCTNNGLDNQVNNDLWYSFTAPANGVLDVSACDSGFDTKLALYINPPCEGHSTYVSCSDDSCGLQSAIFGTQVVAGYNYIIRVGGYQTSRGTGNLIVNFSETCPADFNGDDGVDGDDVIAFFAAWDSSDPAADFNGDGGVDGDDVIDFFAAWDSGC